MQAGFESDASGAVGVPSQRRVTFVLTDPPTAEEARDGGALAPRELLAAAGAVSSSAASIGLTRLSRS